MNRIILSLETGVPVGESSSTMDPVSTWPRQVWNRESSVQVNVRDGVILHEGVKRAWEG